MSTVLGIDPGAKTTGIAWVDARNGELLVALELLDRSDVYREVWNACRLGSVVVCESYVGCGQRDSGSVGTIELIGGIKAIHGWSGRDKIWGSILVFQQPQRRRRWVTEARAIVGPGKRHAADAYAHVKAYLEEQ